MTSIVAATGGASPRTCLHTLFVNIRARGCTGGPDAHASRHLVDFERPRANAPRVDVKEREPVPACEGRTGVDVPAMGEPLRLVHHEMPVHQDARSQASARVERWAALGGVH